ncbi:30707_t:CDS:2, partial [Racocetra persica]
IHTTLTTNAYIATIQNIVTGLKQLLSKSKENQNKFEENAITLYHQGLQYIYWKLNAKEYTCTNLENILFNYLINDGTNNKYLNQLQTIQQTDIQLEKEIPYSKDKFDPRTRDTGKEILKQRPPHTTLKLLDASVQTAALITFSQMTYIKRLEKESKIGVTSCTYELHKSIITTEQRLQQAHLLNRAHAIQEEIRTAN